MTARSVLGAFGSACSQHASPTLTMRKRRVA
ncbi:Uncharacterised protein [Bordetella pertussis]|nr:Uncharacterised protein [Bordetella pertussis]